MDAIVLSVYQMRAAEAKAIEAGTASYTLMTRAGEAVAREWLRRFPGRHALVLAGIGHNGGDGLIAGEHLRRHGVRVCAVFLDETKMSGDAKRARADYQGEIAAWDAALLAERPVVIDALFGTGLSRPLQGLAGHMAEAVNASGADVVAVDMPSGVDGDTGWAPLAVRARVTVTFQVKKPGHLLLPGRTLAGTVVVADIGLPITAIQAAAIPLTEENGPALWRSRFPWSTPDGHKYARGHVLIKGGAMEHAGAAKLAALMAHRAGAGLVTIVADTRDVPVYAMSALSLMTQRSEAWETLFADARANAVLIGPGAGVSEATHALALAALKARKSTVLDADALRAFSDTPDRLFEAVRSPVILTPHGGEFAALFPDLKGAKTEQARIAAGRAKSVVVFKGADTVVAAPDGRVRINANAPPTLATAGTGDALAGLCAGLLAQGMEPFDAASAAVWLHGAAASQQGAGLIADDLPQHLPFVLQQLKTGT